MNTVLRQELVRFNRLIETIRGSLKDVLRAVKGLIVMSEALDKLGNALFDGKV